MISLFCQKKIVKIHENIYLPSLISIHHVLEVREKSNAILFLFLSTTLPYLESKIISRSNNSATVRSEVCTAKVFYTIM